MTDRITPYKEGGSIRERIDEIAAENASVHFEMMDFDCAFLCITSGGMMRRYWFGVKKRSLVLNLYEECEPGLANQPGGK